MLNKKSCRFPAHSTRKSESGVTLFEMVVALMILTVGLLGLAGAITFALGVSNRGRGVTNAKQLVTSMLEQIETLRNSKDLTYGQIANTGPDVDNTGNEARPFGGFPTDFVKVSRNPGPDGIFGTTDDLVSPGADGIYGTTDDVTDNSLALPGFTRQITITFLNPNLKKITVTLKYPGANGQMLELVGVRYLNNDAHSNYL
jgi:type II secretory pathway pseudopilin PulG